MINIKNNNKAINSYCDYYYGVLHNKNLADEEIINKLKERFGSEIDFSIIRWGRTSTLKSIYVNTNELFVYIIPMTSINELLLRKTLGKRLHENHKWVIPPYITMKSIFEMEKANKISDLELIYESIYNCNYFATQLMNKYSNIEELFPYTSLIKESVECFLFNRYAAAITLLLTIIDGISREFCKKHELSYDSKGATSAFYQSINYRKNEWKEKILLMKNNKPILLPKGYDKDEVLITIDEAMDMFVSFEKYGYEYLFKSNSNISLNRHNILHGISNDYCIPINFYRLYSCLEMMVVVVSNNFMGKGVEKFDETLDLINKFNQINLAANIL